MDGAKFSSSMDLCSGYWQVKLSEEARDKTSFYGAEGGLWKFTVIPFGLCNTPVRYERLMESLRTATVADVPQLPQCHPDLYQDSGPAPGPFANSFSLT